MLPHVWQSYHLFLPPSFNTRNARTSQCSSTSADAFRLLRLGCERGCCTVVTARSGWHPLSPIPRPTHNFVSLAARESEPDGYTERSATPNDIQITCKATPGGAIYRQTFVSHHWHFPTVEKVEVPAPPPKKRAGNSTTEVKRVGKRYDPRFEERIVDYWQHYVQSSHQTSNAGIVGRGGRALALYGLQETVQGKSSILYNTPPIGWNGAHAQGSLVATILNELFVEMQRRVTPHFAVQLDCCAVLVPLYGSKSKLVDLLAADEYAEGTTIGDSNSEPLKDSAEQRASSSSKLGSSRFSLKTQDCRIPQAGAHSVRDSSSTHSTHFSKSAD